MWPVACVIVGCMNMNHAIMFMMCVMVLGCVRTKQRGSCQSPRLSEISGSQSAVNDDLDNGVGSGECA